MGRIRISEIQNDGGVLDMEKSNSEYEKFEFPISKIPITAKKIIFRISKFPISDKKEIDFWILKISILDIKISTGIFDIRNFAHWIPQADVQCWISEFPISDMKNFKSGCLKFLFWITRIQILDFKSSYSGYQKFNGNLDNGNSNF
jgi:hypothetical protein